MRVSRVVASRLVAMPPVEVERRFAVRHDTSRLLLERGAKFVGTSRIHDVYVRTSLEDCLQLATSFLFVAWRMQRQSSP
jgi:hypothetical protein